ncbi:MAG: gamma-glutamyltransferase [Planctomycetota bacterium]
MLRIFARNLVACAAIVCVIAPASAQPATMQQPAKATAERTVAIATVHPLATDAAMEVYEDGGNAVDAAIAAALTLGVVDSHNSGIGGGCLALVRLPNGQFLAIDGREMAPAAATRDMFVRDGKAVASLSQTGPLAAGVPGALAAYQKLNDRCGELPLSRLLQPGIEAAEQGFAVSRTMASALRSQRENLQRFPASQAAFLNRDGKAPAEGDVVRRPDLARTYRALASDGIDWFYHGKFAQQTKAWMQQSGGLLTAADFAGYEAKQRTAVRSTYRGLKVVGFPPPSSGGVHVAQMLNLLEPYDVQTLAKEKPADYAHLLAEVMKLAFADRAHWLGDADFAEVPRGLASKAYADKLRAKISLSHATTVSSHGTPKAWRQDLFGRHTTHIAAADSEGYWVAITATVNTSFGSKVVIPGTGVVLNNEMDDFSTLPGAPNAFQLVGAENNAVAPGKRPLSSMSPTIVVDANDEPLLTVGAAGGPKIITQVLQAILGVVDRNLPPEQVLAEPRVHHQWRPDRLSVERTISDARKEALAAKGHKVAILPTAGVAQMIVADPERGLVAVNDPRIAGKSQVSTLPVRDDPGPESVNDHDR